MPEVLMDIEKLEKLNSLKEKGVITQEEFDEQKKIILKQGNTPESYNRIAKFVKDLWNNYLGCLKKYFKFSGRATRYEFWGFALVSFLISLVLGIIDSIAQTEDILRALFALIIFLPSITVSCRRLHDAGKSAWNLFMPYLILIPIAILFAILEYFGGENNQITMVKTVLYILGPVLGYIYVLFLTCKKSDSDNKYGTKCNENEKYDIIAKKMMISWLVLFFIAFFSLISISAPSLFSGNEGIDEIKKISSNVRDIYAEEASYDGLNNEIIKQAGGIPSSMYSNLNDGKIFNAFGGEVSVMGLSGTFVIFYSNLPNDICMDIADYDFGYDEGTYIGVRNPNPCQDCQNDCAIALEFN